MDVPLSGSALSLLILFALSAFFSGSETAFFSISRFRLQEMAVSDDPRARRVARLMTRPHKLLTTILLGNMTVNIMASAIVALLVPKLLSGLEVFASNAAPAYLPPLISVVALTSVLLIFCEVGPKSLVLRDAERFAVLSAPLLIVFARISSPVRRTLLAFTDAALRLFRAESMRRDPYVNNEAELMTMVTLGEEGGVLREEERRMIQSIFEFEETTVKEILAPRTDVTFLNSRGALREARGVIAASGFSRYPVYGDSIDNIVGVLYAKDLIQYVREDELDVLISKVMRKPHFVPETKHVGELFREMQAQRFHLAVVVDEYGGTAGIVTLEDIVEEVTGEIFDEFDASEVMFEEIGPHVYRIDGRADLDDVEEKLGVTWDYEEHETVGGLLLQLFGQLPRAGDSTVSKGYEFTVLTTGKRTIRRIRVERSSEEEGRRHADNGRAGK